MVHVQVREEHGLQAGEVETGFDKGRRCPSSAVDHEDPLVDRSGAEQTPAPLLLTGIGVRPAVSEQHELQLSW